MKAITLPVQQNILGYIQECISLGTEINLMENRRENMERIDRAYYRRPAVNNSAQESMARAQDKTKIDDVQVPIVETQVESAHSYLVETFLTGHPIFGVVSDKQGYKAAAQIQAIMAQHEKIGWHNQLSMWFRDGLRYNLGFLEAEWFVDYVPNLEQTAQSTNNGVKVNKSRWEGNKLTRWDPYNTFWDPRVKVCEVHIYGEYCGHHELWNRIRLKKYIADQKNLGKTVFNAKDCFFTQGAGKFGDGVYFPDTGVGGQADAGGTDWVKFGGLTDMGFQRITQRKDKPREADTFMVTTVYARILPSDFGINGNDADYPQIWKFVVVNGQKVIIAEPMGNAHNYLPVFGIQPQDENLGYAALSMADSATGFQAIGSALWKIAINGARRHLTDRMIYDPSKIDKAQINNPNPSAKIPLRPAGYGSDIRTVAYQLPSTNLDTGALIAQAQQVFQFANMANGQNQAGQGQFVKGNKTKFEYQDIMSNSTSRNRQYALSIESQALVPLKFALLYNILQFQPVQTLFDPKQEQMVKINPAELRQAVLEFGVSDGYRPSDKMMDGDSWSTAMTALTQNPALGQNYEVEEMFAYLMTQRGADVTKFIKSKEQRSYEQALASWQQAAVTSAEKGAQFTIPQPTPEQFGYTPSNDQSPSVIPSGPEN